MDNQSEHDVSHRQEREHKKEEHKHSEPGRYLSSLHPAWYVVAAVIFCGAAVLIWTFIVW
jgi:fucose permease